MGRRWPASQLRSWRVGHCAGVCIGEDWDVGEGRRWTETNPVSDYGKGMMGEAVEEERG